MRIPLILLLVAALAWHAQAQDVDLDIVKAAAALEPAALTIDRLPATRPAMPRNGWNMCTYSCMSNNLTTAVKTEKQTPGVFEVYVNHKPIKGVTSQMLAWMYANLNETALHPVDKKLYKIFLLFHPVDALDMTPSTSPVTAGTTLQILETLAKGCSYNRRRVNAPWTCPKNRTGLTASTGFTNYPGLPFTDLSGNNSAIVRYLNTSGFRQVLRVSQGQLTRTVTSMSFSWVDTPQGLQVKTTLLAGLMADGSDTAFDALFGGIANPQIIAAMKVALGKQGLVAYCQAFILHILQAFDWTKTWLPKAYAAAQGV